MRRERRASMRRVRSPGLHLRLNPFDTMVAGDGDGLGRGVDLKEGPGAGDKRIFFDDAFVDGDAKAGAVGHEEVAVFDGKWVAEDFVGDGKGIHADASGVGVAGVFKPFNDVGGPADAKVRGGEDFKGRSPTVEGEAEFGALHGLEDTAAHREAALAADVHLDVIGCTGINEVAEAGFLLLVFAGGDGDIFCRAKFAIGGVVGGREWFFEPRWLVAGHGFGE